MSVRLRLGVRATARVGLAALVLALAPAVASADAKAGEQKAQLCLLCHKPNNPAAYVPTLEGQPWQYLYNQIKAYREERRPGDIMQTNVRSLTEADIRDLADFFAAQTPVRVSFALDPGTVARGRARASELRCGTCHRASFSGEQAVPRLAGLDPRYGLAQILDFIGGKRPHPSLSGRRLSADDAAALAQFFASLD